MKGFAFVIAILLAIVPGTPSAGTRGECVQQCPVCGGDAVCGAIYDSCMNRCMSGSSRPAPLPLPDVWGAIAVSPSTLRAGGGWNYKHEEEAAKRALQECQSASRAGDCKVVVTVADVCVSLAISKPEKVYAVGGPTGAANYANGNATLMCQRAGGRSCEISLSFCADGIRHEISPPSQPFGRRR
jgi:Domain of unknown function (DUF4189)